jgi:hypothetical protein
MVPEMVNCSFVFIRIDTHCIEELQSPLPVSGVTFMSLDWVTSSERGTMDMERSFGMTHIFEMDIRPHPERELTSPTAILSLS